MVQTTLVLLIASPLMVPHLPAVPATDPDTGAVRAPAHTIHQLEPAQCTDANPGQHVAHRKTGRPRPTTSVAQANPLPQWQPPAQPHPAQQPAAQGQAAPSGPGDHRTPAARERASKAQIAAGTSLLVAGHALNLLAPPAVQIDTREDDPKQRVQVGYSSSTHSTGEIVLGAFGSLLRAAGARTLGRGLRNARRR